MIIGISKADLEDRLKMNLEFYDEDNPVISTLRWLIGTCEELDPKLPVEEYALIPQTLPVDEGTVIRITDGPHVGLWKSTREGWVQVSDTLDTEGIDESNR